MGENASEKKGGLLGDIPTKQQPQGWKANSFEYQPKPAPIPVSINFSNNQTSQISQQLQTMEEDNYGWNSLPEIVPEIPNQSSALTNPDSVSETNKNTEKAAILPTDPLVQANAVST